jgi:arabinofuranosyltransferase
MSPRTAIIILLLAVVPFLALSLPFYSWIPDDAYISFQYARSFAEGDGLVFNPDERVEGFSNPLWTLLLAAVARLGRDIEVVAPLISYAAALLLLGAFLALLAGAYPASESISRRNRALVVGSMTFAFGAFFPLAFYATSGLETVLFVLCLVLGARLHLRAGPRGSGWVVYASLAAFLVAALLRPEGIGFLLISIVFLFFKVGRPSGRLLAAIVLALFAYLTALSIRFEYFGSVLPNTYFAKPPVTLHYFAPLWRGLAYVSRFLAKSGVVLLIVFALVIPQDRRKRYAWLYLWAMAGYQLFFIVVVGADVLRFDRFAVPLAPWLYALAGMGFLGFLDGAEKRGRRFARRVVVVGVVLLTAANAAQAVNARARFCFHDWMHSRSHRAIGEMLRDLIPPGAEIVANEIGAVRYHSRRPVIDMLGLTDETVASIRYRSFREFGLGSSEWSARAVTHYLLSRDPECILVPSTEVLSLADKTKHRDTMHPLWYSLLASPNLEDRYRPVLYAEIHRSKYFYVFLRNDIKFPPAHFAVPREECLRVHRLDD